MSDKILRDWGTETARRRVAQNLVAAACVLSLPLVLTMSVQAQGPLRAPFPERANDFNSYMQSGPAIAFAGRPDRSEILDLEPAVVQAELILAVRLVDVTETKIVHGGRDVRPHHREKHHVSLRGLRDRPRRGQRAQVGDDLVQGGRTAAVTQHHAMTGRYQMTGEGLGNGASANGSKVHEPRISQVF